MIRSVAFFCFGFGSLVSSAAFASESCVPAYRSDVSYMRAAIDKLDASAAVESLKLVRSTDGAQVFVNVGSPDASVVVIPQKCEAGTLNPAPSSADNPRGFVCHPGRRPDCMPQRETQVLDPMCSYAYRDWAAKHCEEGAPVLLE